MSTKPSYPDKGAEAWTFTVYPPMRGTVKDADECIVTVSLDCGVPVHGVRSTFTGSEKQALRDFIFYAEGSLRYAKARLEEIEKEEAA